MRDTLILFLAVAALGLTACSSQDSQTYVVTDASPNYLSIRNGKVVVHAPNRKDAVVTEAGKLSIGEADVNVTAPQRGLLMRYYAAAKGFRDQSRDLGGASSSFSLVAEAAGGMVSGDLKKIEGAVNTSSAKLISTAGRMCNDLATLTATQDALADQIPDFRPYAQIKATEAADCRREVDGFANSRLPPRA